MTPNSTTMPISTDEKEIDRWSIRDIMQIIFFAVFLRPLMKFLIGYRVYGKERLPLSGPFVLIANHSSHLDTVSLLSLFPLHQLRAIQPVAAADYFERNRLISWFSRSFFNILPIERHRVTPGNNPIDRMIAALRTGKSLILFPEGTRGSDGEVSEFRPGIARLVEAIPGLRVVPVYLINIGRCMPKGSVLPAPLFCEARVGEPRSFYNHGNRRRELLEKLRASVCELREADGGIQPAREAPIARPRPKVIPAASNPKMTCRKPE